MGSHMEERIKEVCEFTGKSREEVINLFQNSMERLVNGWEGKDKRYDFYRKDYYLIRQMSSPINDRILVELRELIDNKTGRMLDYGCGVGDTLIYAAERGWEVEGVDVGGIITDFCEWRMKKRGFKYKLYKASEKNEYPRLPRNHYDLIVSGVTMEHLEKPSIAMLHIYLSLKKGAKKYILIDKDQEIDHIAKFL